MSLMHSTPEVLADHLPPALETFYRKQSAFSDPGAYAACLDPLPSDPAGIARVVQGLLIYEHVAAPFYGCPIPDSRRGESHIRTIDAILDTILRLDRNTLGVPRPPERRLVGICRHFTLLAVALFRHGGIPARARVGFGDYFNPGTFEDHWLCEYWRADLGRWALLDPQFDDVFIRNLAIRHDVLDVPRAHFLTAADAWHACRRGEHDPASFGIEFVRLRGLWFVAGSLVRDMAALNGHELLAWDMWGAQPAPSTDLSHDDLAYFDELATLLCDPDHNFDAIRRRFTVDDALRVPPAVFNSLRQREERVLDA